MYVAVLLIHSWLRYLVLAFGLWLLIASVRGLRAGGPWSARDERVHTRFLAILDTQFLLGLLLYFWLSPITSAAFSDMAAAMKDPQLRFFGVEHITAMLVAVAIAHIGRVRARRKQSRARYRTTLIAQSLWLLLTLAGIPWPGLDVGRPLFRGW
jgi:hypothetical protein